jgi:hypothetical protein
MPSRTRLRRSGTSKRKSTKSGCKKKPNRKAKKRKNESSNLKHSNY